MYVYKVHLDMFEGPLDLLLYLIKELEIDIDNIPMETLTHQYMDYIHEMKALEINIASEYLVMASELLKIKSACLLPELTQVDDHEEDLKASLVEQLLQYQNYKEYAALLDTLKEQQDRLFTKPSQHVDMTTEDQRELDVNINELIHAFRNVHARIRIKQDTSYTIERERLSYTDAKSLIVEHFRDDKTIAFENMFHVGSMTKYRVVTIFIVLLEMLKNNELTMVTADGNIHFERLT